MEIKSKKSLGMGEAGRQKNEKEIFHFYPIPCGVNMYSNIKIFLVSQYLSI